MCPHSQDHVSCSTKMPHALQHCDVLPCPLLSYRSHPAGFWEECVLSSTISMLDLPCSLPSSLLLIVLIDWFMRTTSTILLISVGCFPYLSQYVRVYIYMLKNRLKMLQEKVLFFFKKSHRSNSKSLNSGLFGSNWAPVIYLYIMVILVSLWLVQWL